MDFESLDEGILNILDDTIINKEKEKNIVSEKNTKLSMFENGLDFICESISYLEKVENIQENQKQKGKYLKYSLLHLSSGLELILKHRLYMDHWIYVFADMNKANRVNFKNGEFKSVDSETAIKRLEDLCDIRFCEETKKEMKRFRSARNKIEHFEFNENIEFIEAKINKVLKIIIEFISENLDDLTEIHIIDLNSDDDVIFNESYNEILLKIIEASRGLNEQYENSINLAKSRANKDYCLDDLIKCPNCSEKLLKICNNEDECYCYFCQYTKEGVLLAKEYIDKVIGIDEFEIVKNGGEYPLYTCPECDIESLVLLKDEYTCFNCDTRYNKVELSSCSKCGNLYELLYIEEDIDICNSCKENVLDK